MKWFLQARAKLDEGPFQAASRQGPGLDRAWVKGLTKEVLTLEEALLLAGFYPDKGLPEEGRIRVSKAFRPPGVGLVTIIVSEGRSAARVLAVTSEVPEAPFS